MEIPQNWTFERQDIAKEFNRHVREQLPWYDLVSDAIIHFVRHYAPTGGVIYDIGCSTGNIGVRLADLIQERGILYKPIESSQAMCNLYQGPGQVIRADAITYEYRSFDVAILFLVMMFFPIKKRERFLQTLINNINPGGAIIIVDKCLPFSGYLASVLWRLTLAGKLASGVTPNDILAKELSLGGVQRPVDPSLFLAGKEWFHFGDFAGWIIEG